MDEKDRTIVTFGGDPEPEKISQNSGFASGQDELRVDVEIPQEVKPEVRPYKDTGAGADTGDYLEDYKTYVDRYNAEHNTAADLESAKVEAEKIAASHGTVSQEAAAPQADYSVSKHAAVKTSRHNKPARDPRYVTKGALAVCMVLTMLVSSVLGGLIGGALSSGRTGIISGPATDGGSSSKSISEATGSDLTISEIVDMNADSVVEILVSGTAQGYFGQMQPVEGAGSGVIYSKDGYIVTNYHVIQGANKVQVTLHNGETYPASIVGGNNDMDIAVIKINANDLKPAKVGDSSTVEVGDTAVAIGNPLGQLGGTATTGIISALDRNLTIEGRTLSLMQTDAAINGGNSGGGLFNSKGELIGIVDAKSSGVGIEGLAFALPINSVVDDIDDIIENGNVSTRPVVGVTIADVSEDTARYYQLESAGVYITQVTGENAKKAGFQSEDRIVSLDGEEITSSQQFVAAVRKHKAGDVVTIVVSRSGQEIEIKTELEEYTESNL
jgi:serine protease Do